MVICPSDQRQRCNMPYLSPILPCQVPQDIRGFYMVLLQLSRCLLTLWRFRELRGGGKEREKASLAGPCGRILVAFFSFFHSQHMHFETVAIILSKWGLPLPSASLLLNSSLYVLHTGRGSSSLPFETWAASTWGVPHQQWKEKGEG